jgi:hypothetical protein
MLLVRRELETTAPYYVMRKSPGKDLWTIYYFSHNGDKVVGSKPCMGPLNREQVFSFLAAVRRGENPLG